tara:strand:+ start:39 stop:410 length:372 start_codon:yes stop_codon:yes gene_type:complete
MVSRKDNPDYKKVMIKNKNGKSMTTYKKIKATDETGAKRKARPKVAKKAVAPAVSGGALYTPPTDQNKPITKPSAGVAQSVKASMLDTMEGLSQKEIDRLNRVKARVAQVRKSQAPKRGGGGY